jgi:hypothetical protein
VDESAGVSSADLTLGSDVGKIHVDTQGDTSTLTLSKDVGKISVKAGENEYTINMTGASITVELKTSSDTQSLTMDGSKVVLNAGATPGAGNTHIGGESGQELATKAFVTNVFQNHMHGSAPCGPPSPPIPLGIETLAIPDGAGSVTHATKAE